MKTKKINAKKLIALAIGISTLTALPLLAGPEVGVGININVPVPPPVVVVPAPPAPPAVTVTVPESYVYDGTEYVGVVGSQYFYLGPGDVWLTLDGPRLERWHKWEVGHADWRSHTIRNVRYRHDAHGHDSPVHEQDHGDHDRDHGHDGDHH